MSRRTLRRALLSLTAVLIVPVGAHLQAQQGQSSSLPDADFVYVNTQAILQQAPGADQARETWASELEQYRSEVEALRSEIDSLRSALGQQREMLSEDAVAQREQEIQQKQQELAQRVQELERQAAQRQQELLGPILEQVRTVLQEIREEQGYTMVFDASAAGVLAADPNLDITEIVIQRLQEQTAGGAPSAQDGASSPDA